MRKRKKVSIFIKILFSIIALSVFPVAISNILTVSTYEEIISRSPELAAELAHPYSYNESDISKQTEAKDNLFITSQNVKIQVALIIFLVGVLSTFTSVLISRSLTRPIKKLVLGTKEIASGNLDFKISIETSDEIGDLAQSFNLMTTELKTSHDSLAKQRDELGNQAKILAQRERDLSEINAELEYERDKTDSTIKYLTDGIVMIDMDEKITLFSPKAEELLGVNKDEVLGKSMARFAGEKFNNLIKTVYIDQEIGENKYVEIQLSPPVDLILRVFAIPVFNSKGEFLGTMKILHDYTREKAIDKMKSEFISVAAHQLRTPLSAIKWTMKMMMDGDIGKLSDEQKIFLNRGYQSNERMISLVNDLLNVSRIEEGKFQYSFEPENIEEIVESLLEELQPSIKNKKIKLTFIKSKIAMEKTMIDKDKMRLALQNLIDNAIKYTPNEGKVIIKSILDEKKKIILIQITDSGVGIPKKQQNRIFTKFFRADNVIKMQTEGSGLGLFIARNIAEKHKGRIELSSHENKGTRVVLSIPLK